MELIKGKVDGNAFHLNTNVIVDYLGVVEGGDTSFFVSLPAPSFLEFYLLVEKVGSVLMEGVSFNPVKTKDLIRMILVFWQIIVTNILPQVV